MSDDEIDMQYYEMVQANTIKGVHSNSIEGGAYNFHNSDDHDISREYKWPVSSTSLTNYWHKSSYSFYNIIEAIYVKRAHE